MARNEPDNLARANDTNAASGASGPNVVLIALAAVAAAAVVFFLRNSHHTRIDFLVFNWDTTVRWLIVTSIVLGALLDRLGIIWWRRRRNAKAKEKAQAKG